MICKDIFLLYFYVLLKSHISKVLNQWTVFVEYIKFPKLIYRHLFTELFHKDCSLSSRINHCLKLGGAVIYSIQTLHATEHCILL